jgi:serine/threonine-protein kinase HipA
MKRTIRVFFGEEPRLAGVIRYDIQGARENAAFEYAADWIAAPGRFAIDPELPLVSGVQFHKKTPAGSVFHSAIADTEPDGWGRRVIQRDFAKRRKEARRSGRETEARQINALDYLLAVDDQSRVGALRFQDENGVFQRAREEGRRTTPPLIELRRLLTATRAVETGNETAADLDFLRGRGTSLGGMRPKCSVLDDEGRLSIAKFPSVLDERAVTKGEILALRLASMAGINAAEGVLIESDGTPISLVRRFDRPDSGGRLMYVSAATMLGAEPGDPANHTYCELADALRKYGAPTQNDIDELWRRVAFSILITNVDDHLRNHGFLHIEHGQWRLAPAFDINPFPDRFRELKTWVSEDAGPESTVDALMSVTPYFHIAVPHARKMLGRVERAVARWRAEGRALGMSSMELDRFAEAFEHPERSAARRALGTR